MILFSFESTRKPQKSIDILESKNFIDSKSKYAHKKRTYILKLV